MNKRTWALLFVAYIVSMIITAPAGLFSRALALASDGRVELANTQGTIWSGAASPVFHQRNGSLITLSALHWNIEPLALLTGKLNVRVNWDSEPQAAPMYLTASIGQVELRHAYIPLPAILLEEASDFLKPAALRGQIIFRSDALFVTKQGLQGAATADWLNASSLLSSISPLGDYHFTFSSTPAMIDIALSTTSGALILAGQGHFSSSTGLDFNGTAQAASGKEDALRELLSHLGPQVRPGVSTFSLVPTRAH